jgi:hypothetical membrane protein
MVPWHPRVATIGRRRPGLGPVLYVSCVQYFVVQVVVADHWRPHYSWSRNTISDLGNTICGRWNGQPLCSPQHDLMNVSFVLLGAFMLIGSVLNRQVHLGQRGASIGFRCMEIAGAGVVLVGLFPENSVPTLHGIGATLSFVFGNVAIIVLGCSLRLPFALRVFSLFLGVLALAALIPYASSQFLGLGNGGLERVVAFPQTVWLIVLGAYLLTSSHSEHAVSA